MFFKHNFPWIIWAIIILVLIGLPPNDFPSTSFLNIPHKDKIVHTGLFFIFAFLLARGFVLQNKFQFLTKFSLLSAFIISSCYGGLTELLQGPGSLFPLRSCDFFDFVFDSIGSLLGILLFIALKNKISKRGNPAILK